MRALIVLALLLAAASCDVIEAGRIESAVLDALAADQRTSSSTFEVSYQGEGKVVITGEAGTPAEVDAVTEIAKSVEGVTLVVNNCHVEERGSGMIQDEVIPSPFL